MNTEVLEFINRRFGGLDANWCCGNCFFFSVILKSRFPQGKIYYKVIDGHFIVKIDDYYYDWLGAHQYEDESKLIQWDKFEEYDPLWYQRIVRDCIM